MTDNKPWIKRLAAKQAEVARKLQSRESIPPWWKAQNENTLKELNAASAEQILHQIDKGFKAENCPAKALKEIEVQVKTFVFGMDQVRNATKREPKNRDKLEKLFRKTEMMINNLDNGTGFDLYDSSTWENPNAGHADNQIK